MSIDNWTHFKVKYVATKQMNGWLQMFVTNYHVQSDSKKISEYKTISWVIKFNVSK